jgi:hypothetical protein
MAVKKTSGSNKPNNKSEENQEPIAGLDDDMIMDEAQGSSPALNLGQTGGAQLPATPIGSQLLTEKARSDMELSGLFEAKHVGGSLPVITFERRGQSFIGMFVEREEANDRRDFAVLVFDLVDVARLRETRDPAKSIMVRAQLTESTAVEDFFAAAKVAERRGKVYRLVFVGTTKTKRGQSDMKLITVEELRMVAPAKSGA